MNRVGLLYACRAARLSTTAIPERFELQVGIEIHARALAQTKLFSDGRADANSSATPNSQVSLFDAAIPGTLPRLNEECVDQAIRTGLALGCKIETRSMFERKHYYYCDLPHGYQITQQRAPIVTGGAVEFRVNPATRQSKRNAVDEYTCKVRLSRIQLEQDSGKSTHSPLETKIDLNRAGAGLMEIVSEPDLKTAEEAAAYVSHIQSLLRQIGTCDGNMENGSLRADINISVSDPATGRKSHRVEIKNLNSLRSIRRAIEFEHDRLNRILAQDEFEEGTSSETRAFDVLTGTTNLLRTKERGLDYRFMPEPDLPALVISHERIQRMKSTLPELPRETVMRLMSDPWNLSEYHANLLVQHPGGVDYIESTMSGWKHTTDNQFQERLSQVLNWVCNIVIGQVNASGLTLVDSPLSPRQLAELVILVENNKVSSDNAKKVLKHMTQIEHLGKSPKELVKELKLETVPFDEVALLKLVNEIVFHPEHTAEVEKFRGGKKRVAGFFVGKVMAATKGSAPAKLVSKFVMQALKGSR